MSDDKVLKLLRRWNLDRLAGFGPPRLGCEAGPSRAALYLLVTERAELSDAHRAHLAACPVCQRLLARIQRDVENDRSATERPAADRILPARAAAAPVPQRGYRWALGGGLAAAMVLLAMGLLFWPGVQPAAFGSPYRAVARQILYLPGIGDPLLTDDPAALLERQSEIARFLQERDGVVARCHAYLQAGLCQEAQDQLGPLCEAWSQLYRRQRDLGNWSAAADEARQAVAYIDFLFAGEPEQPIWRHVCTLDLGDILATMGDYSGAQAAYEDSLAAREAMVPREASPRVQEASVRVQHVVAGNRPLRDLALAQGQAAEAARWHARAEADLRAYLVGVCRAAGREVAESATLVDSFREMPPRFRLPPNLRALETHVPLDPGPADELAMQAGYEPSYTIVMILRQCVVDRARMFRAADDFTAAAAALHEAQEIPYYFDGDEWHQRLQIALEWTRIYLARGDFCSAKSKVLDAAEELERSDKDGNKPKVLSRVEVQLLRGAIMCAPQQSPEERAEGRRLIANAVRKLTSMGESLSAGGRERLRKQVGLWRELATVPSGSNR